MTAKRSAILGACLASLVAGCVTVGQSGPSVDVAPGRGKTPEQFSQDERACQIRAWNAVGGRGSGREVTLDNTIAGAAIGAGAGAIGGSAFGQFGTVAQMGGATGGLVGSIADENKARAARRPTQAKYDSVYTRCMVGRGHRVVR